MQILKSKRAWLALLPALACASAQAEKSTVESVGDGVLVALPLSAWAMTYHFDDSDGREAMNRAFLTNLGITFALKYSVDKERPDGSDNQSFPSGHTSVTFQSAAFIQRRYGWRYGLPAYAAAAYTGWSRIDADKHYASDVIAGAAIGVLSSLYFTTPYPVTLSAGEGRYGVNLTLEW